MYHNIERSGFRRGEYVGYAHGVWRIRRIATRGGRKTSRWEASFPCIHTADYRPAIIARTLREISTHLDVYVECHPVRPLRRHVRVRRAWASRSWPVNQ